MSGMSDSFDPSDPAGDYVLGLLRGGERRAFEAEMALTPGLADEVAAWEQRLLPLALAVPAARPPQALWNRIEAAIAPPAPAARTRTVAPPRQPGQARRGSGFSLWRSLAFWRGFSLMAAVAAIILAILRPGAGPPAPDLVAILQATPQAGPVSPGMSPLAFTLAVRPDGGFTMAPVSPRTPPRGHVWQLWAIAPAAKPVSLGLVRARHTTRFKAGQIPVPLRRAHVLIAVSLEPPGGSPTGQPTGPVVFTGPLLRLR
jgi:anti-sigma-K factor RskA